MPHILSIALDILMIGLLAVGIMYANKLMQQLATLRASHTDMERFVSNFNATVTRADASIKGLKQAARSSGDDLETLIEKAQKIADELTFLTEAADHIATRLSSSKIAPVPEVMPQPSAPEPKDKKPLQAVPTASAKPKSAAEQELLNVLEKLG